MTCKLHRNATAANQHNAPPDCSVMLEQRCKILNGILVSDGYDVGVWGQRQLSGHGTASHQQPPVLDLSPVGQMDDLVLRAHEARLRQMQANAGGEGRQQHGGKIDEGGAACKALRARLELKKVGVSEMSER